MPKTNLLAICFLTIAFLVGSTKPAAALSLNDILTSSQSFFTKVTEKIELVLAFTPTAKVAVLEKQAEKRLTEALGSAQNKDTASTNAAIKDYENLKTQQAPILGSVGQDVIDEAKDNTIDQQEKLLDIVDISPGSAPTVSTTNKNVVEEIKKTVWYKEGTTAGEDFGDQATIVYAPGTGPGGDGGGIKIEGGELHTWAPGTSAGGEGGVTYEGGAEHVWAPGTSGSGGEGGVTYEGGKGVVVVGQ